MNNVKKTFAIRDLENLSGIKAHTIRIWEKRYGLLEPERTATNIRTYSLKSLQKLLNITLLYNHGVKISKIADIAESDLPGQVRELVSGNTVKSQAINTCKLAMINFDQALFQETYEALQKDKSFREIFWDVFIPLLEELGLLWQTESISPAHEHFITHLIQQKIQLSTEQVQARQTEFKDRVFVLFLPENEIHEIGLLFLNYELACRGYRTIYLGQTIPLETLTDLTKYFEEPYFVSYFTVSPTSEQLGEYLETFEKTLMKDSSSHLWILGRLAQELTGADLPDTIRVFNRIDDFLKAL